VTNTKDFFSSPSASRICSGGRSSRRAIIELFQFVEPAAVIQRGFGEFCLSLLFSFLGFNSLFACKISCGEFGVLLELGLNISPLDSWTVPFGVGILVICLKTRAFFCQDLVFSISLCSSVWHLGFKASPFDGNYGGPLNASA